MLLINIFLLLSNINNKSMNRDDLKKIATPADRRRTAQIHGCSENLVYCVLNGIRNNEQVLATLQQVVSERIKQEAKILEEAANQPENSNGGKP